jgi:hypothetical protein
MEVKNFNQRGHEKTVLTFDKTDVEEIFETIVKKLKKKYATQIAYNSNGKHQFMINGKVKPIFQEILNELGTN